MAATAIVQATPTRWWLPLILGVIAFVAAVQGGGWLSGALGAGGILFGLVILAHPLASTLALPVSPAIVLIGGRP